jgi:hypothetical protein
MCKWPGLRLYISLLAESRVHHTMLQQKAVMALLLQLLQALLTLCTGF